MTHQIVCLNSQTVQDMFITTVYNTFTQVMFALCDFKPKIIWVIIVMQALNVDDNNNNSHRSMHLGGSTYLKRNKMVTIYWPYISMGQVHVSLGVDCTILVKGIFDDSDQRAGMAQWLEHQTPD